MIKFNREVTSPKFDCVCVCGLAAACLVLALVPPYGMLTIWWAGWSAMNFAGSRRLYLKMKFATQPQRRPPTPEPGKRPAAANRWTVRRHFLWRAPLRGARRGQHVKK